MEDIYNIYTGNVLNREESIWGTRVRRRTDDKRFFLEIISGYDLGKNFCGNKASCLKKYVAYFSKKVQVPF